MISYKKSYAEQMLQLALALSLLQVDPELYMGRNWDSQLPMRNGDAWELEMLRAVPMTEYPYANRKAMIPLIEDLVRFDRTTTASNYLDITAYLLNVQNAQTFNKTSSDQSNTTTTSTTTTSTTINTGDHNLASIGSGFHNNSGTDVLTTQDLEQFINSEIPIIDSTTADFNDFEFERMSPLTTTFYGPLKDEPPDYNVPFDIKLEQNLDAASTSANNLIFNNNSHKFDESGGIASWHELLSVIKKESEPEPEPETEPEQETETEIVIHDETSAEIEEELYNIDVAVVAEEIQIKSEETSETENDTKNHCENDTKEPLLSNVELTEEESEIVEVLWKQDVDLGFSLSPPKISYNSDATSSKKSDDENEKLKALEELKDGKTKKDEPEKSEIDDEWAGIPFTIDNETGEYIRLPLQLDDFLQDVLQLADLTTDNQGEKSNQESESSSSSESNVDEVEVKKYENLSAEEENKKNLEKSNTEEVEEVKTDLKKDLSKEKSELISESSPDTPNSNQSIPSPLFDFDDANELEEEFDMMIQSAAGPFGHHQPSPHHRGTATAHHHQAAYGPAMANSAFRQSAGYHHHHHHHQSRVPPLSRGVSMEQRLQDIASLFNPMGVGVGEMAPYSHYPNPYYQSAPPMQHSQFPHHPVLHNSSLAAELGAPQPHYGHNLGSAVTSSMHLTNASHENDAGATAYKMEHEMMYYSNTSSELNHTTDGFINSILNDEDLQLMDMNVNEGFCPMRMVDSNATSNNSSALGSTSGHSSQLHSTQIPTHLRGSGIQGADGTIIGGTTLGSDGMGSTGDRLDASSDSAVSSMGSERVPSLSDGEWGEGSDSAQDYHQGKYGGAGGASTGTGAGPRPHDYSYNRDSNRLPPVAQKKHQMYGKRYFQDQPTTANLPSLPHASVTIPPSIHTIDHMTGNSVKYEYDPYTGIHQPGAAGIPSNNMEGAVGPLISKEHHMANVDFKYGWSDFPTPRTPRTSHEIIGHNHTYTLPQGSGSTPRPQLRDKKSRRSEDEHLTRDEKRARALNVPITVQDIINLPMDEFNERLSKYDLTESQLSLIRDIRRRGKNKVAAQNCRKRKLDQILSLEDEVKEVRRKKEQYYSDRDLLLAERNRVSNKFAALHRHIFQYLRDPDGNLCSPSEYSLQQAADGSVYLLRRDTNKPVETNTNIPSNTTTGASSASATIRNGYDSSGSVSNGGGGTGSGVISTVGTSHHYHPHHHHHHQGHHSSQQRPSPSSSQHHQKE